MKFLSSNMVGLACFLAAAALGWMAVAVDVDVDVDVDSKGRSTGGKTAVKPVPTAGDTSARVSVTNWEDEKKAIESLPEEEKLLATLRLADRIFRRDPEECRRYLKWVRERWPDFAKRHPNDWGLVVFPYTRDDERLEGLYGFYGLEEAMRDPERLTGKDTDIETFVNAAARQNPEAFLTLTEPFMSGKYAKYFLDTGFRPAESPIPFSGAFKERVMAEIKGGPLAVEAANTLISGTGELSTAEAGELIKTIVERKDVLKGAGAQSFGSLVRRVAREDPNQVVTLMAQVTGKYREWLITGLARADVPLSLIEAQLSPAERAAVLVKRLDVAPARGQEDVAAAISAVFAETGEGSEKLRSNLAQSLTSGAFDPAPGLNSAMQQPAGPVREAFIGELVSKWAATDVVGVTEALAGLPAGAVPDSAISGIMSEIRSDPTAVISWAARISDPAKGRKAALKAMEDAPLGMQKQLQEQIAKQWPGP